MAIRRKPRKPKLEKFFIIWNPIHPSPPRVQFTTFEDAEHAAKSLAQRNPGAEFFILEVTGLVKAVIRPPKTTKVGKPMLENAGR